MLTKKEQIDKIKKEIEEIDSKNNKVIFFIPDTKGNPSGSLQYIYRLAKSLMDSGVKVEMIHQEKDFVGPYEWLDGDFKQIPHFNTDTENVEVSPSDMLVIPEVYSNILSYVKKLPCKKVMLFQNFENLTEFMPLSVSLYDMGISDAITTSNTQKEYIEKCFPFLRVHVIEPGISGMFRKQDEPQKLVVNIVSRHQENINKIVKPFYWQYPIYKWVSFRDLRGMTQEKFGESLRDGAITLWIDDETQFGYSAIEALKSGSIVIGKVPDNPVDWMVGEDGQLISSILWFDNIRTVPGMLASVVRSWTLDLIPEDIYGDMSKMDDKFKMNDFDKSVNDVFVTGLIAGRKKELEEALNIISINNKEENNEGKND